MLIDLTAPRKLRSITVILAGHLAVNVFLSPSTSFHCANEGEALTVKGQPVSRTEWVLAALAGTMLFTAKGGTWDLTPA